MSHRRFFWHPNLVPKVADSGSIPWLICPIGPLSQISWNVRTDLGSLGEGGPRWLAADCISGLQYKLQRKRLFPVSWNYLSIWDKYELPQRASQVSIGQVMAISGMAFYFGLYEFGVVVVLAFSGMLRTAEIWELRGIHISFEHRKLAMMLMSKTGNRTGHPETVVVDDFF